MLGQARDFQHAGDEAFGYVLGRVGLGLQLHSNALGGWWTAGSMRAVVHIELTRRERGVVGGSCVAVDDDRLIDEIEPGITPSESNLLRSIPC